MQGITVILVVCLAFASLLAITSAGKMLLVLQHAEVKANPRFLNSSASVTRYNKPPYSSFDLTIIYLQKLNELTLQVSYTVQRGRINSMIYNNTLDLCAYMKRPNDRFVKMVFDELKRHGPVPSSCPIRPMRLVLKNVTLNHVNFPSFLPETNFLMQVNCLEGPQKIVIYESKWYGHLKRVK